LLVLLINILDNKHLINKILAYSAIKIIANITLPYSTLNPDTNSDSPSAKSKGVRFVSATEEMKIIITIGKNNKILNHVVVIFDINTKLKLDEQKRKNSNASANITS